MADRYSFSLTTFSPSGKLVQIEYALNAVNQGVTALATNGIVLATEKKSSSPLTDPSSLSKVSHITPNIGMVYAGMGPDYRVLVDRARKVSHTGYKRIYNEYPPTRILVQDVARVMQEATQSGGVRPYGVSLLIAGWDEGITPEEEAAAAAAAEEVGGEEKKPSGKTGGILKGGPMLYQVDPSGSYFPWKATAIGKSATTAKTFLEKRYTEGLELEDAIHIALLTLKETIEGEMNGETIEIGIVGAPADHLLGVEGVHGATGPRFRKLTPQEIEDYLTNL
ncbi:putative proteasome subunit alpha type-2 protein [Eutypa lata UCREL1]|uniref:Proteasome subunit alpha type n=1 Tax=Eutypa lata (strain UCR-EL1) TaxID=1287681 RepID=M7TIC2_EUTLA|nr:putative proteasome subunit alpha type-2 protein [Eutypa lata UCREL1]